MPLEKHSEREFGVLGMNETYMLASNVRKEKRGADQ